MWYSHSVTDHTEDTPSHPRLYVAHAFAKAEIINTYGSTLTDAYAASRKFRVFMRLLLIKALGLAHYHLCIFRGNCRIAFAPSPDIFRLHRQRDCCISSSLRRSALYTGRRNQALNCLRFYSVVKR